MAKYPSSAVGFMLLGGYSMLGAVSMIEDTVELKLSETPVLGQADEDYFSSGAKKTTVTQDGWFDDATNSVHEAFKGLNSTVALPLSIAPHGNVAGYKMDFYPSVQRVGYNVQLSVGEVHKAKGEYGIYYGRRYSTIVAALTARGAASSTDAADVTCSTVQPAGMNGGAVVLHMTELSGCASCTVTFRHSTDGTTYADKQVFTAVPVADVPAGALAGQYITLTGQMNQYVSVAWTYASATTPSATFTVGVYVA